MATKPKKPVEKKPEPDEVDLRFKDSLPLQAYRNLDIGIAGLGASGRNVAILLDVMGNKRIVGADPDVIELKNVGTQGWARNQVGLPKVLVLMNTLFGFTGIKDTFQAALPIWGNMAKMTNSRWKKKVIFCCVDTMRARSEIWELVRGEDHLQGLWIDSRMAARQVRIITIPMNNRSALEYYDTTLYGDESAFQGSCTDRMTLYGAYIAAGLMVSQLANWLNKLPLTRDFMLETMGMGVVRIGEEE